MYDSSKTKFIKLFFDKQENIDYFVNKVIENYKVTNNYRLYPAQVTQFYIEFKKIFRDRFFKKYCIQYNLLSSKEGLAHEDKQIIVTMENIISKGLDYLAQIYVDNLHNEKARQKSSKYLCYSASEYIIEEFRTNKVLNTVINTLKHTETEDA